MLLLHRIKAVSYTHLTDDHTAVFTKVDAKSKTITPYIRNEADFTKTPVTFAFNGEAEIQVDGKTVENGSTFDLSKDQKITFVRNKEKEEWTIKKAIPSNNPVLPGQYADPDLDYFDGKFWLFPTTDGYPGWSLSLIHISLESSWCGKYMDRMWKMLFSQEVRF